MEQLSDEKLVSAYRKGNEAALQALINRYLPLIYGFSKQYSGDPDKAADIAQETFIKVWKNIKKFDTERSFRSWIFTIAKNTALDWLKRRHDLPFSSFETYENGENPLINILDSRILPSVAMEQKFTAEKVNKALEHLPEHYEKVVSMHMKEQLTFQEIAKKLRAPLNTVKSRYRRALHILKNRLGESE